MAERRGSRGESFLSPEFRRLGSVFRLSFTLEAGLSHFHVLQRQQMITHGELEEAERFSGHPFCTEGPSPQQTRATVLSGSA